MFEGIHKMIMTAVAKLDDDEALNCIAIHDKWQEGVEYTAGTRLQSDDGTTLYEVLQAHTSQADWPLETTTALYSKILTSEDGTPQEWEQPDSTNGYEKGDRVIYNGVVYESVYDGLNVWSPEAYPDGWVVVEE